jgi:hypothetical protein
MEFVLEAPGGEKLSARCVCVSLAWLHGEEAEYGHSYRLVCSP